MNFYHPRSSSFAVNESSQVGEARRAAALLGAETGFNSTQSGEIAVIVTEIATNLHRHAKGGQIIFRALSNGEQLGMEILSVDQGPGMTDVSKCMRDGYSTAGSQGTGLGAISRLSTLFDVYSIPNQGTVILCQIWSKARGRNVFSNLEIGSICLPVQGESACGDAWAVWLDDKDFSFVIADGLGHGLHAADAANEAVRVFKENRNVPLETVMSYLHGALQKTRGAAIALANLDIATQQLRFVGVGNIAGSILAPTSSRSFVSHNGTVGHTLRTTKEFSYPWPPDSTVVFHSDGLSGKWRLEDYPGLLSRHPSIIAAILYRDYRRVRDDVTVVVARRKLTRA